MHARKQNAPKEVIKNSLVYIKDTLVTLLPSPVTLVYVGFYVLISNFLTYFIASMIDYAGWLIPQLLVGACFLGYCTFISETIPSCVIGLFWAISLYFCFPINVLWHWWHSTNLFVNLGVSLTYLVVVLLMVPLYLGVSILKATLS